MHISFIFLFFDSKPGSSQPICGIIIANKSFSSAKAALVCSFRASWKNRRHLGCSNVMRSRGCAVQNKGITLNGIMQWNTRICGRPVQEQVLLRRLIWSQTCLGSGVPIWCHEDLNNNIQYFWTETYLLTIRFIHRKTNELFPYKTGLSNWRKK